MEVDVDYFRAAVKGFVILTAVWFLLANSVAKFKRVGQERKGWDEFAAVVVKSFLVLGLISLIVSFF